MSNIANLTREQKLELLEILEEKRRREAFQKPTYKPHSGQLAVHKSKAKVRFVTSGNGFGKSTLAVQEAIWRAEGYNPITNERYLTPAKVAVLMDKPSKFEEVFLTEARKWYNIPSERLHKKGKPHLSQISFDNGSTIAFYSHDQDPLTFESIELDFVVADEPFPREIYVGLRRAGRRKGVESKYLLIGTPIGQVWMKEQLWDPWEKGENPEIECFRGSTQDNAANLADGYINSFSSVLSDSEREVRLKGGWFNSGGLALAHLFRREVHLINAEKLNWDVNNPCVIAIDCHVSKPHAAVLVGVDRDGYLFVLDEYKSKAVARDFAKELIGKGWLNKYRIMDIIYDSLGQTDGTGNDGFKSFGAVFNEVLAKHKLGRARATSYDEKNEEEFISRIQETLLIPSEPNLAGQFLPKLRIVSHCINLSREIETIQWEKTKGLDEFKPRLAMGSKDMIASLKYALATNIYYKKSKDKIYYNSTKPYGLNTTPARGKIGKLKLSGRTKYGL